MLGIKKPIINIENLLVFKNSEIVLNSITKITTNKIRAKNFIGIKKLKTIKIFPYQKKPKNIESKS